MIVALSDLVRITLAGLAMAMGSANVCADTKVALIIGNSKYQSTDPLKNPADDAVTIKNALTSIGFNVSLKQDVTGEEFRLAIRDFAREASNSDIALFYFAGHGVELQGQNYFLPIDTKLVDSNNIQYTTMPMDTVLSAASNARKAKIIILDSYRSRVSERRELATRSLSSMGLNEGFAPITQHRGQPGRNDCLLFHRAWKTGERWSWSGE